MLKVAGATPRQFVWGADWQTVPALIQVRPRHLTALILHNVYDEHLGEEAAEVNCKAYSRFRPKKQTALRVGLENVDVASADNRGFVYGLHTETIYTKVLADHLQKHIQRPRSYRERKFFRTVTERHGPRGPPCPERAEGLQELGRIKQAAHEALPPELHKKVAGKVLFVAGGRRVVQKQHDVIVDGVRAVLKRTPNLPLFVFFATTPGEDDGSQVRLERIHNLSCEYPENVYCTDGPARLL